MVKPHAIILDLGSTTVLVPAKRCADHCGKIADYFQTVPRLKGHKDATSQYVSQGDGVLTRYCVHELGRQQAACRVNDVGERGVALGERPHSSGTRPVKSQQSVGDGRRCSAAEQFLSQARPVQSHGSGQRTTLREAARIASTQSAHHIVNRVLG